MRSSRAQQEAPFQGTSMPGVPCTLFLFLPCTHTHKLCHHLVVILLKLNNVLPRRRQNQREPAPASMYVPLLLLKESKMVFNED
uniref:Putative secreted peptide n=1 Tax=Anopheles braziliensis TaxID=58242 RepID=A0A2M3ZRN8_9DIPT